MIIDCSGSSNLVRAEYNEETLELTVEFKRDVSFVYSGVPVDLIERFVAAPSKGSFLRSYIVLPVSGDDYMPMYPVRKIETKGK